MRKDVLLVGLVLGLLASAVCQIPIFAAPNSKGNATKEEKSKAKGKRAAYLAARGFAAQGFAAYRQSRFDEAIEQFKLALEKTPLDATVQYYLGLTALHKEDYALSERALSRAIVMSPADSSIAVNVGKCFDSRRKEFQRVKPYSCVTNGSFFRWTKERMPIRIYLSHGEQLPNGYVGAELTDAKLKEVGAWLRNPSFVTKLKVNRHYRDEYGVGVKSGLSEWAWADTEGCLKYSIVDDPSHADLLVFYCPSLPGNAPGWTVRSAGKYEPVIVQFAIEYFYRLPLHLWPVIIKSISGHEFGHAFGLADSPFKRDLMHPPERIDYVNRGTDQSGFNTVTNSDASTLRALYEIPAPIMK